MRAGPGSPEPQSWEHVCRELLPPTASEPAQSWAPCTGQVTHTGRAAALGEAKPWCDPSGEAGTDSAAWEVQPARIPISSPGSLWPRHQPQTLPFPMQTLPGLSATAAATAKPQAGTAPSIAMQDRDAQNPTWSSNTRSCLAAGGARCPHQCDHPHSSCGEIPQCPIHLGCTPQDYPHIHKGLAFLTLSPECHKPCLWDRDRWMGQTHSQRVAVPATPLSLGALRNQHWCLHLGRPAQPWRGLLCCQGPTGAPRGIWAGDVPAQGRCSGSGSDDSPDARAGPREPCGDGSRLARTWPQNKPGPLPRVSAGSHVRTR